MANRINDMNNFVASKIEAAARKEIGDFSISTRLLHLTNNEFDWLNDVKRLKYTDIGNLKVAMIVNQKKDSYYLVVSSVLDSALEINDESLEFLDVSTPIFIAAVNFCDLNVLPSYSSAYIKDLMYAEEYDERVKSQFGGYELENISNIFDHIDVFKCPSREYNNIDFLTLVSKIVLDNRQLCKLDFTTATFPAFEDALLGNVKNENLLCALNSYCWRYCFLDVYRCVEPLFPYPSVLKLKDLLGMPDLEKLKNSVSAALSWKAKEENAMQLLFDNTDTTKISFIDKISSKEGTGKKIYELRNRIVHHQNADTDMETVLTKEEWDSLICFLLENLNMMYSKYGPL